MNCKICNYQAREIFQAKILNKYGVAYFHCENCGFLQTEEPFWLKESYEDSMNMSDTGILMRNMFLMKCFSAIAFFCFNKKAKFLDYAGGYGVFTRLMRDIGFDFFWHDPYTKNILAQGFEYEEGMKIEMLTSFESFEHFASPLDEIEKMLKISKNIFFSTNLLPDPIPKPAEWWYYGLEHGQHIAFYSTKTLEFIANKYNLNFYAFKNIHLLTSKKMNPLEYKFLVIMAYGGLFTIIRKIMKSKTFGDMQYIISEKLR